MRWWILFMLGCGSSGSDAPPLPKFDEAADGTDSGGPAGDTGPLQDTGDDFCDEAPVLNWNNFGQGFLTEACQSCHAESAPDRYGAPEDVVFDTVAQTWDQADRVLARAIGDTPSMPPLGGTHADDRLKLEYWLLCGSPGS